MEIIIIAVIVSAFIIFFVYASKSGAKMQKERQEIISRAEKGKAKILGFSMVGLSGTGSHGRYQAYKFTLEVSSEFKSAYRAEAVWEVYPMGAPKVQEGMEVDVKIDSENPDVIYLQVSNVEYSWMGAKMEWIKKQA